MNKHNWINDIHLQAKSFLDSMSLGDGRFKYSYSGDLISQTEHGNLGASVFALKILYMISSSNTELIKQTANYIKSFNHGDYIYDDIVAKKRFFRNILSSIKRRNFSAISPVQYKKADTRQSLSSLMLFDYLDNTLPIPFLNNTEAITNFLRSLDWSKPWDAGSHFSHLMFFLSAARDSKKITQERFIEHSDCAIAFIRTIENEESGSWYIGEPTPQNKVNGAMKILTGLAYRPDQQILYPEKLVKTCFEAINLRHGCDNLNLVYTLNRCFKQTSSEQYRSEVTDFLDGVLDNFKDHYHSQYGGFSFFKNKANDWYYSAKISEGKNEPDIHGTVLFLWGISLIDEILEGSLKSGLKPFRT